MYLNVAKENVFADPARSNNLRWDGFMSMNSIRRTIMRQAGGANKLGWFSWAAAIFGAVMLLLMGAATIYQLASAL